MTQIDADGEKETKQELAGKRILVAGAAGFLGKHLVHRLAQAGAKVLALSRKAQTHADDGVRWIHADMTDLAAARSAFGEIRPDIVYQLCGHPDGGRDIKLVLPTLESDILTTVNLLLAAVEKPVQRFVTTASLEESEQGGPPTCPYAAAKMASGSYARMFGLLYNVPIVILRPFMTYGPGQPENKVVSYMTKSLVQGTPPQLSSGNRLVDWIYVDDVIDGFLAAATAKDAEGCTVDLGTGQMVSIRDVGSRLAGITKSGVQPAFGAVQDRPFERIRSADTSTAKLKLGWQAKVPLDEGLRLTVDWWQQRLATGIPPVQAARIVA